MRKKAQSIFFWVGLPVLAFRNHDWERRSYCRLSFTVSKVESTCLSSLGAVAHEMRWTYLYRTQITYTSGESPHV